MNDHLKINICIKEVSKSGAMVEQGMPRQLEVRGL